MIADALIDPLEFDLELLRGEPHGAEHTETAGFTDGDHDVAAVGEREDGKLDTELIAEGSVHDRAPWASD